MQTLDCRDRQKVPALPQSLLIFKSPGIYYAAHKWQLNVLPRLASRAKTAKNLDDFRIVKRHIQQQQRLNVRITRPSPLMRHTGQNTGLIVRL